jgi:ADP-heptose:LPS heptosyltransferase
MMPSLRPRGRALSDARIYARAARARVTQSRRRPRPGEAKRILVAHHLLLGDTVMSIPLLAKLRATHPAADIVLALPGAYVPLFEANPYGVRAIGWNPREASASPVWQERGFDLAFIPGDNRVSWLAYALGARWIVAFAGDRPAYKSWPIDELKPYPEHPAALSDMIAGLAEGPAPTRLPRGAWPAPHAEAFDAPGSRYAVLHLGASTPLKAWLAERWRDLARWLTTRDVEPVWSAGRGEEALVAAADPERIFRSYAGAMSLAQLIALLRGAALVVSPDTAVAHLGRLYDAPTVTLFGPGSPEVSGAGTFWRDAPWRAVTVDPFECRDQPILFKREIAWVRRCGRTTRECAHPRCMDAIELAPVIRAIEDLGAVRTGRTIPIAPRA